MSHRPGRYRALAESRAPRQVTADMRDRCERALAVATLSDEERIALDTVVLAHKLGATINKGAVDRAGGVLGRLQASR